MINFRGLLSCTLCIFLFFSSFKLLAQATDTIIIGDKVLVKGVVLSIYNKKDFSNKSRNATRPSDVSTLRLAGTGIAQTNNDCGVKASFTPSNDTAFANPFYNKFTNTSTNATSISWVINGYAFYGGADELGYVLTVGLHEIKLVARNGSCTDTAVCFYFCSGTANGDRKSYMGHYGLPDIEDNATCMDTLTGGSYLLGGYSYKRYGWGDRSVIMKVRETGCVEWTKTIEKMGRVKVVKGLSDGGFFVSGYATGLKPYLMRFDKEGNVLWERSYDLGVTNMFVNNILELDDGSVILTGTSSVFSGFIVAKITSAGAMLWSKHYARVNLDFATPNSVTQLGNNVFISGYIRFPNNESVYNSDHNQDGFILKIDAATGTTIWTKHYGGIGGSDFFHQMYSFGPNLIVNATSSNYIHGGILKHGYHIIDKNGTVLKSAILNQTSNGMTSFFGTQLLPIKGDRIYLFNSGYQPINLQPGYMHYSNVLEIDTANNIYWQKTFSNNQRWKFEYARKGKDDAIALLGTATSILQIPLYGSDNFLFARLENGGFKDDYFCGFSTSNSSLTNYSVVTESLDWTVDEFVNYKEVDVRNEVNEMYAQVRYLCPDYIDSCSYLKITGRTTICNLSETLTYTAHKNTTCQQPVEWSYDPSVTVLSESDRELVIKAPRFGNYKIAAQLRNSCTPVKDSLYLVAAPKLYQFSLGKDTAMCPNTSFQLKAGKYFLNYKWQDDSNDSSLLVTAPGIYWVEVEDSCGNVLRDSINIAPYNISAFELGPDLYKCDKDTLAVTAPAGFINYTWTPAKEIIGAATQKALMHPSVTTKYIVTAEKIPGCYVKDSVLITVNHAPVLSLGIDTVLCKNDIFVFQADNPSIRSYNWQDGSTQSNFVVSTPGTYWVKAEGINGCISSDTIVVTDRSLPNFSLGGDTTLCEGQFINYNFALSNANYTWSDGTTLSKHTISKPGLYWLEVNNGCIQRDSISVAYKPSPQINLGRDTILCEGATKLLNASYRGAVYQWQDKSTSSSFMVTRPGVYYATVNLNGCIMKDSIRIDYRLKPRFSLGKDTMLCVGDQWLLSPQINNASYRWQNESSASTFLVRDPGTYSVIVTNECGSTSDEIVVTNGVCQLYMPNAFTPNNDGVNDVFRVKNAAFIQTFKMTVYDRWGGLVFTTTDPFKGWDGKYVNAELPSGNYIWQISLVTREGVKQTASGNVLLVR